MAAVAAHAIDKAVIIPAPMATTRLLVLFWSLDRLSREGVSATLGHLERLTSDGVNWRSYTEEYVDSTGLFRDAVMSGCGEVSVRRRPSRGCAARGRSTTWARPRLVVDRDKARRLHEQGMSVRKIAHEMGLAVATTQRIIAVVKAGSLRRAPGSE